MPTATRQLPPDPRTIADMIPVRRAEIAAIPVPNCSTKGHGRMRPRPLETQTYEAMYCGIWWECQQPGCRTTSHRLSRELAAYHDEPYWDGHTYQLWNGKTWDEITKERAEELWKAAHPQTRRNTTRKARR